MIFCKPITNRLFYCQNSIRESASLTDNNSRCGVGVYFTFGGVITFVRDYDEIIKYIPLDRILLDTDAAYVAPEPYRGQRNEPVYVIEVVKKLAEIKMLISKKSWK